MRVIVETNSRVRVRTRTRVKRAVVRLLRFLAGAPDTTPGEAIVVRRVSRVGTVVRAVVPDPLIENRQARAMATGLVVGIVHVAFALVNVVMGLLAQSVWILSVGIVIAGLNAGKSYLASGALMSVTLDRRVESDDSLRRCRRAGTALALAVLVMSGTVARIVLQGFGGTYPGALMYIYAAYAFVLVTVALVNLVRARREETLSVKGVRVFNLASAIISIFALQTVVLSRVDWEGLPVRVSRNLVEGTVGGLVCLVMVVMGLWLALTATARLAERGRSEVRYRARR